LFDENGHAPNETSKITSDVLFVFFLILNELLHYIFKLCDPFLSVALRACGNDVCMANFCFNPCELTAQLALLSLLHCSLHRLRADSTVRARFRPCLLVPAVPPALF
jgi:hypothetical protein